MDFRSYLAEMYSREYSNGDRIFEAAPIAPDSFGKEIGITDKSDSSPKQNLEQPKSGPIGDISKSAWANLNVPTRGIPNTGNGSLGCAAATSIMFYRATGYPIIPGKKIELDTAALWNSFTKRPDEWKMISNWRSDYQPGDIILTSRGSKPGHVGIVVDDGKVISNSSGGFRGDKKGQIEQNYTVNGWSSIAKKNPNKTACFRYIGKWRKEWGGAAYLKDEVNTNDPVSNKKEMKHILGGNSFTFGMGPGEHNKFQGWQNNNSWDLIASAGTPVCSIFSGKVESCSLISEANENVFGWSVLIKSDSGIEVYYANLSDIEPNIKKGSIVKVGDLIGYIGKPNNNANWKEHVHVSIGSDYFASIGIDLKKFIDDSGNIKNSGETPMASKLPMKSKISLPIDSDLIANTPNLDPSDFEGDRLVLRYGNSGDQVRRLQKSLINNEYPLPENGIDGVFGKETLDAVKKFQAAKGLNVDGQVGEETSAALSGKQIRSIKRSEDKFSGRVKFKIYDKQNQKVLIAKIESNTKIIIKNRYGLTIGEANLQSGRITITYTIKGNTVNLTDSDETNSVYRGIYNIFNRFEQSIISEPLVNVPKEREEQEDVVDVTDFKVSHSYSGEKATNIGILLREMQKAGITNPYAQIGMLAVIGKESAFIPKNEIMSYSKERLPEVWGVFSKTGKKVNPGQGKYNYNSLATQYERQPQKLANFVYGQKPNGMRANAYGNTQPEDGWKYRGRGFNGITFKSGYERYSAATGIDLVSNPDRLNDINVAAEVAVKYFLNGIKSLGKDINSFTNQTDATYLMTKANAGTGNEVRGTETYANAQKVEKNFRIS